MSRRTMLTGLPLAAPVLVSLRASADDAEPALSRELDALAPAWRQAGVAILNGTNGVGRRDDERLRCAARSVPRGSVVLARVDRGRSLSRRVVIPRATVTLFPDQRSTSRVAYRRRDPRSRDGPERQYGRLLISFGPRLTSFMRSLGDT
jgi:hypothetical protein